MASLEVKCDPVSRCTARKLEKLGIVLDPVETRDESFESQIKLLISAVAGVEPPKERLESQLKAIGVNVPDQRKIPHMMEATRLGLPPTVSPLRLKIAWYRRWKHRKSEYVRWDYEDFIKYRHDFASPGSRNRHLGHEWGGMPPEIVMKTMEIIKKRLPALWLFIDATKIDPYGGAMDPRTGEVIIFHCWTSSGPHEKVIQVF